MPALSRQVDDSTTTTNAGSKPPTKPVAARVAWAAAILASPHHTPRQRHTAYDILEHALMRYWYADTDGRAVDAVCEQFHVDRMTLRRSVGRLSRALPSLDRGTFDNWCSDATAELKQHPVVPGHARAGQHGRLTAGDQGKKTPRQVTRTALTTDAPGPRVSVVHQAKGAEADAVMVIIPAEDRSAQLSQAWISGEHPAEVAENMRVLYVAVTRARLLLAITVPNSLIADIRVHLTGLGVPVISTSDLECHCLAY